MTAYGATTVTTWRRYEIEEIVPTLVEPGSRC